MKINWSPIWFSRLDEMMASSKSLTLRKCHLYVLSIVAYGDRDSLATCFTILSTKPNKTLGGQLSKSTCCPSGFRVRKNDDLSKWRPLPGGGGALAGQPCTEREQRTAKLTLSGVFDILKLIPLFTLSSQKVTLSDVVN